MLIDLSFVSKLNEHDFCVIGAGPAGIALSLSLSSKGYSVLLLEAGSDDSRVLRRPFEGVVLDPHRHADLNIACCHAIGGTSKWWGGRCVPLDEIDFEARAYAPGTEWPISLEQIWKWYPAAAQFLGCGPAIFNRELEADFELRQASADTLERWSSQPDMAEVYREQLLDSTRIAVLPGATVTNLKLDKRRTRVESLSVCYGPDIVEISVRNCILACGGIGSTSLLLEMQQRYPSFLSASVLGSNYMGHISGKIADLVFANDSYVEGFDFFLDGGKYARRRLTLKKDVLTNGQLLNVSFWIDNPPFHDPSHKNSVLSAVWLALAIPVIGRLLLSEAVRISHVGPRPYKTFAHLTNIFRSPFSLAWQLGAILYERYFLRPRKPGFLVRNKGARYALHYHAEQRPSSSSTVTLRASETHAGTSSNVAIDLRYSDEDARSIVQAHTILDEDLRRAGLGRLEYRVPEESRQSSVMRQASDGFHQIGTTRMSADPAEGIVDQNCRVNGIDNLYVLSSSVFPSSGQANPTLTIVALAYRLAEYLDATALIGSPHSQHSEQEF